MTTPEIWDAEAATFDDEPDHGLADPAIRQAWRTLLLGVLPPAPARIADLGCGTGTLSKLLADEGFDLDGVDFAPAMVERASAKVPEARFHLGDAAEPPLDGGTFDVVLCRHVLWAFEDPCAVVRRWTDLLASDGRLVLIEGRWHTGGGLRSERVEEILRSVRTDVEIRHLPDAVYWGAEISDERYLAVSRR